MGKTATAAREIFHDALICAGEDQSHSYIASWMTRRGWVLLEENVLGVAKTLGFEVTPHGRILFDKEKE